MPKRFYLATQKDSSSRAETLLKALSAHGWQRTYTWTNEDTGKDRSSEIALAELQGVKDADVLIALLPAGFGTHVEIGAALAWGKPVILHAPDEKTLATPYPCPFHYHPGVKLLVSEVLDTNAVLALLNIPSS